MIPPAPPQKNLHSEYIGHKEYVKYVIDGTDLEI